MDSFAQYYAHRHSMLPGGDGQEASGCFPTYKSDGGGHGGETDGAQTTRAIWIGRLLRHTEHNLSSAKTPLHVQTGAQAGKTASFTTSILY